MARKLIHWLFVCVWRHHIPDGWHVAKVLGWRTCYLDRQNGARQRTQFYWRRKR